MNIEINVPDGISGGWAVETFTVSEDDAQFARMRAMFHGGRGYVPAGTYKRLIRTHGFKDVIMSNTPDEIRDFMGFVWKAKGSVLVNGLGLGVLLKALIDKPDITDITVIEKSEDVIKLVAPTYLTDKRVTIINADAFEYEPPQGKRYNAVWHDIWDGICSDNLKEMEILHRKYGRKTDYQESWCREQCKRQLADY
jgi:hypothetical protein